MRKKKFGFTLSEVGTLIMNGVEAAFLEDHEKRSLKQNFRGKLAALGIY